MRVEERKRGCGHGVGRDRGRTIRGGGLKNVEVEQATKGGRGRGTKGEARQRRGDRDRDQGGSKGHEARRKGPHGKQQGEATRATRKTTTRRTGQRRIKTTTRKASQRHIKTRRRRERQNATKNSGIRARRKGQRQTRKSKAKATFTIHWGVRPSDAFSWTTRGQSCLRVSRNACIRTDVQQKHGTCSVQKRRFIGARPRWK